MSQNVFWRDVPKSAAVELRGKPGARSYWAKIEGSGWRCVYWNGADAREAQREMDRRARKSNP